MEATSSLLSASSSYLKTHFNSQPPFTYAYITHTHSPAAAASFRGRRFLPKLRISCSSLSKDNNKRPQLSQTATATATATASWAATEEGASSPNGKEIMPKIDKSGRFCSPRAARELALMIVYAACLEGSDPIRLFEKRMNARREPGYEFDKSSLLEYNHMTFGGPPVTVDTVEEANELERNIDRESAIEAEILSAPPKLVYSKLLLRLTRKLLVAVVERWDSHVLIIDQVAPENWKNEPAGRILELCILHLAMSEITVVGTRHQIVINEAVDLAKRFCDGAAPRIINGCLSTFIKGLRETNIAETPEANQKVSVEV